MLAEIFQYSHWFLFPPIFTFIYLYVRVLVYVMRSEKGVRVPVTGDIGSCEVPYLDVGEGVASGPLEQQ